MEKREGKKVGGEEEREENRNRGEKRERETKVTPYATTSTALNMQDCWQCYEEDTVAAVYKR